MNHRRAGFTLITVLWVMATASVITLGAMLSARDGVQASLNRGDAERARWRANDCEQRARAAIDAALATGGDNGDASAVWRMLDRHAGEQAQLAADCDATLEAAGTRLSVNDADSTQLRTLFRLLGLRDVDGLVDALQDWRDIDDEPRSFGAERDQYVSRSRMPPSNAPLESLGELRRVIGFDSLAGLDVVLDVEPGRVSINTAPRDVLLTIPGFTEEVVERILTERAFGRVVRDLLSFSAFVSHVARDSLLAHFPEISRMATVDPDAWTLIARGRAGSPPVTVVTETRLTLGRARAVVARWRTWP